MFMSMLSLCVLFAAAVGTHATCANNETYSAIWDSKSYTCSKLRMDNNRGPRFNLCKAVETRIACPHSCGTCCEDDPLFKFGQKSNDKQQGCDWILKSLKNEIDVYRQTEYCNGYWDNGATIRAKCQVSCDFCFGTQAPTPAPTVPATLTPTTSGSPSAQPTRPPSPQPSPFPSLRPTKLPSDQPSQNPSHEPSDGPSKYPSDQPSQEPSNMPSDQPSQEPSNMPSDQPSHLPSDDPSQEPSNIPSDQPSLFPSNDPSQEPSLAPSDKPTLLPSGDPSGEPSHRPTKSIKPSATPSRSPVTPAPTRSPTSAPVLCSDGVGTFTLDTGVVQTCDWLSINQNKTIVRKDSYCGRPQVATLCKSSCGFCTCQDDLTYTWTRIFGTVPGSCAWITKNTDPVKTANRKNTYCTQDYDNGVINYQCAVTCGTCTP